MSIDLDAIQARRKEHGPCTAEVCGSRVCQTARDRDALLAYARDLEARIDSAIAECVESEDHAAEYGDTPSVYTADIRAALTATDAS